jgi:hypothetical protein
MGAGGGGGGGGGKPTVLHPTIDSTNAITRKSFMKLLMDGRIDIFLLT